MEAHELDSHTANAAKVSNIALDPVAEIIWVFLTPTTSKADTCFLFSNTHLPPDHRLVHYGYLNKLVRKFLRAFRHQTFERRRGRAAMFVQMR
jgi:hypothetical protein